MKHILVTGGSGFVGSHICDKLLEKGYLVTAVDNLVTGRLQNIDQAMKHSGFRFVNWDVSKPIPEEKIEFLMNHGLHGLFHFACPASPVDFDRLPIEILLVDSFGTHYAVEMAQKYGARLMLASTSEIYGDPEVHPQKESYWGNVNTLGPRACYDETKRFAEAYVSTSVRLKGLNAGIVRIFNTYGPRMRPDDGRVVTELLLQAVQGRPMTLHGGGNQTRSFCYVSDLVEGIVRLFESGEKNPVNIGNPSERSIKEFAELVLKITGSKSTLKIEAPRPDDPRRRCPDITRAREILKWEPKVDLETGLRATLADLTAR